jgi:uncharacterized protein (UPF0179 family)
MQGHGRPLGPRKPGKKRAPLVAVLRLAVAKREETGGAGAQADMPVMTLVPETLARPGARFVFRGPNLARAAPNTGEECLDCPFQKLCFGLAPGHAYEVVANRQVAHPCALHEGGKAHVVAVEEVAFATSLESRHLRGTAATWTAVPCGMPTCARFALCHPVGPVGGARYSIDRVGEAVQCPAGFDLVQVDLRPMPKDAVTGL